MDKYLGKRLDGRYEIREIIGVGGMSVVYKAYDNVDDKIVAIKILKDEFTGNDEFLRRFKNESKAIAVLSHPNIVKVFDVSFGDLIQYIVMEYIDGITLKEFIEKQGSLSWNDALHYTLQILRGLQHAHDKGVVHRDVKPQNIMVLSDGTIKVTDFGIARFARSEQRTITDKAIGSVHYISPEQARGESTDEKADIYSVGVMLYEMITGQLPFQAESAVSVAIMQLQKDPKLPRDINGSIPIGLEQITMHAMQKDPAKRYKSAAEMLCDLEEFKKNPAVSFDYDYFVDDSPTKFIPDTEATEDKKDENEKSPIIPILAGISATFVVAIVILLAILIPKFLKSTGDEIPVPDMTGVPYETIEANEEYQEMFELVFEFETNSEYEYGIIFKQYPEPEKAIKEGGKITLYVSGGEKTVKVPDVYDMPAARAETELKAQGFKVIIESENHEDIAVGNVIRTYPARTTSVLENSEVTIYVSSGAPTVYVPLPNLVGLSKSEAEKELQRSGLTLGEVTEVDSTMNKGYVVSQNPEYKSVSEVGAGTAVDIEISTGKISYTFNLNIINLPEDFAENFAYISVWNDNGDRVAVSDVIDLKQKDYEYTFNNFTISAVPSEYLIRISSGSNLNRYYDIQKIQITESDGSYFYVEEYDNYPKVSSEPTSSTETSSQIS